MHHSWILTYILCVRVCYVYEPVLVNCSRKIERALNNNVPILNFQNYFTRIYYAYIRISTGRLNKMYSEYKIYLLYGTHYHFSCV